MAKRDTTNTKTSVIPKNFNDKVACRILSAAFGDSKSSGNPMITWEVEIIHPAETMVDGATYDLTGQGFKMYLPFKSNDGTDLIGNIILVLHPKLDLPEELDDEDPDTAQYEGICFDMMLRSREKTAQIKNPETGKYEAKLDPETHKPIVFGVEWDAQVSNIIGLSKHSSNNPM